MCPESKDKVKTAHSRRTCPMCKKHKLTIIGREGHWTYYECDNEPGVYLQVDERYRRLTTLFNPDSKLMYAWGKWGETRDGGVPS